MEKGPARMEDSPSVKVAAVQMRSIPYDVEENIRKAESLARQAAAQGARVVVLPELFNTGYCYDDRNFEAGEYLSGPTARWLRRTAKTLNIYIAGTIIERDRTNCYDTLIFVSPQGRLISYRKRWLALQEKCYFKKGDHPLLLETPLGRIGIGVCADMFDQKVWKRFKGKADLLIISSAWPDLTTGGFLFGKTGVNAKISAMPRLLPQRLAESLGAPVVYANLCGPFDSPLPLLYPFQVSSRFVGSSAIYERCGSVVSRLKEEEGIAIGDVTPAPIPARGRYKVELGVRAMVKLDQTLFAPPFRFYQILKRRQRSAGSQQVTGTSDR